MTSAGALVARFEAVVCDLDGVVYRGPTAVPHAVEVLGALEVPVLYATNNASRAPGDVAAHLRDLGLSCTPEAVATSSQAGAWLLRDRLEPGSPVLAVGGPGVVTALREAGLRPVLPADAANEPVRAVLQGYGPGVTATDLAEAAYAVRGWRHLGGHQHRRHAADRPRRRAGERFARRGRRACGRQPAAPGGRQTGTPAVPAVRAAARPGGRSGARRGRPPRHRHRGGRRGGDAVAARAHRRRRPAGLPRRTGPPAPHVGRARPASPPGGPGRRGRDPCETDRSRAGRARRARRGRRPPTSSPRSPRGRRSWSRMPRTGSVGPRAADRAAGLQEDPWPSAPSRAT